MTVRTVRLEVEHGVATAVRYPHYSLRVLAGPDKNKQVTFRQPELRIGSAAGADFQLSDPTVSSLHALILADHNGYRLRDPGSTNGVWVDDRRVSEIWLKAEDQLKLGNTTVRFRLEDEVDERELPKAARLGRMIGRCPRMRELFGVISRAAQSEAAVLILGETGTGKELVAEALVSEGPRRDKPFVVLNCGALTTSLAESELFGHERGAFTGALRQATGAFERAHGGTLFLDEIGDLPLDLQPKLLSALERGWIQRVGGNDSIQVDVRILAATHRDLELEVNRGAFRADLYYRLSPLIIRVPPLRDRTEDIPELVAGFLEAMHSALPGPVLQRLYQGDYPGNVRQLRNAVERAVIGIEDSAGQQGARSSVPVDVSKPYRLQKHRILSDLERTYFTRLLEDVKGNVSEAARRAGLSRVYVHEVLQRLRRDHGGSSE